MSRDASGTLRFTCGQRSHGSGNKKRLATVASELRVGSRGVSNKCGHVVQAKRWLLSHHPNAMDFEVNKPAGALVEGNEEDPGFIVPDPAKPRFDLETGTFRFPSLSTSQMPVNPSPVARHLAWTRNCSAPGETLPEVLFPGPTACFRANNLDPPRCGCGMSEITTVERLLHYRGNMVQV